MSTLLLVWYCLGWVYVAIYSDAYGKITLGYAIACLVLAPIISARILILALGRVTDVVLWRKP